MKNLIIPICFCLFCVNTGSKNNNQSAHDNVSVGNLNSIKAYDKNNIFLGYVTSTTYNPDISIISSTGYIYKIDWSGALISQYFYYSSAANCTGSLYIDVTGQISKNGYFGKFVFKNDADNNIYRVKTQNTDNTAGTTTGLTYQSFWDRPNNLCSTTGMPSAGKTGIEMILTDNVTTGIPATITAPISLVFQ